MRERESKEVGEIAGLRAILENEEKIERNTQVVEATGLRGILDITRVPWFIVIE